LRVHITYWFPAGFFTLYLYCLILFLFLLELQ
jgi:hypothetical protein